MFGLFGTTIFLFKVITGVSANSSGVRESSNSIKIKTCFCTALVNVNITDHLVVRSTSECPKCPSNGGSVPGVVIVIQCHGRYSGRWVPSSLDVAQT